MVLLLPDATASYPGMDRKDIIVIGASAGGTDALQKLVAGFPADLDAAVFVTMHLFERSISFLPDILSKVGPLPAIHPGDVTTVRKGVIYVAPPDYHLILTPGEVHLGHGPKENLQRPCINVMFRSAAAAYQDRVAGVVLTGMLDDGAAGLWEIQQHGGATIVQDPAEAPFPSMPESAIRSLNVQYIIKVSEMPGLLTRLTMGNLRPGSQSMEIPEVVVARQSCPECGGVMKLRRQGGLREYSCHVGHRFGLKSMIAEKTDVVERSIVTALSQSEELIGLLEEAREQADAVGAASLAHEIEQRKRQNDTLRELLEQAPTALVAVGNNHQ